MGVAPSILFGCYRLRGEDAHCHGLREPSARGGEVVRAFCQLLSSNDEGVDTIEGEGEKNPEQRRHEEAAQDGSDGMEIEEAGWGLLRGPGWGGGVLLHGRELHRVHLDSEDESSDLVR